MTASGRMTVVCGVLLSSALVAAAMVMATSATAQVEQCFGRDVTITATAGEVTYGTDGDDVIMGTSGSDDIRALGGDDRVCAKAGDDRVKGGSGDDRISLGKGDDVAFGGKGADKIKGKSGSDRLKGNRGADTVNAGSGDDIVEGGNSPDDIVGKGGNDRLEGNRGGDTVSGGSGNDAIKGGKGDDTISGKSGADNLEGNSGDDVIHGGSGVDNCLGGSGNDTLSSCNEPPNILLLIADDFGVESSICYSGDPSPAPRLAALCGEAVVFENVWSSPTCSPTRSGILTGRHGFRTGIGEQANDENGLQLGAGEWTLPRILDAGDSGYSHANFGKWHLGGDADYPNDMGWDHFSGLLQGGLRDYEDWTKTTDGVATQVSTYATTEIVDDTLAWIDDQSSPWFAWVGFNAPHTPFHLPPSHLHTQELSGTAADVDARPDAYYDAAVEALDTEIGRLLDSIDPAELANTTVIFIGDNGTPQAVSSHDTGRAKGSLHEGGVHVPMMIWGADVSAGGRTSDALAGTIDLHATILELAGVDTTGIVPDNVVVDSASLAPVLNRSSGEGASEVILTELFGTVVRANRQGQAIRNERYKLIEFSNGNVELYDLLNDRRGETPLVSLTAAEQAQFDQLSAQLAAWNASEP